MIYFINQLKKLLEADEIEFENIFIDGTKIEANANKYTFVWKGLINKFEVKLQEKIKKSLLIINKEFDLAINISDDKIAVSELIGVLEELNRIKVISNIEFVNGKGKRKTPIQKFIEAIEAYKENRKIYVSKTFIERRAQSLENIKNDEGILLRINRSIQVEGAFGVLKEDYRFRRFLTRGKDNVKIEFTLLCFGYNINKLHNKI